MRKEIVQNSRILVIDDQPENVLLVERILRQGGYSHIRSTTDSRESLAMFSEFQPDLVALDLRMPNVDGFSFLRQVRSRVSAGTLVPILVLTADLSPAAKKEAFSLGARDFLTKPLDMTDVLLRIYNLLEIRWLNVELQQHNQTLEYRVRERTQELEEAQWEILERLAWASDLRDGDTGLHTQRVGRVAALLAQAIGLPPDQVELIRGAAPLHDVGKIGIPDQILLKPGKLTPDEYEQVKCHAEKGAKLLSGSRFPLLQMAERIARYHHERWDGNGYYGLNADAIPLEARIVSVVDTFDVIVHKRPYQPERPVQEALAIILEEKGKQFDPQVVDAFLNLRAAEGLTKLGEALEQEAASNLGALEESLK
jgi:putative two-component system response regulator